MKANLSGYRIAVLGGDRRELEVCRQFTTLGACIKAVGLPWPEKTDWRSDLHEVMGWADVFLAPVGGVGEDGEISYTLRANSSLRITRDLLSEARSGSLFITGKASRSLQHWCNLAGVQLVEYREYDEFAILNGVPSAEGAVQIAMQSTAYTVWGSKAMVLGYGRSGKPLARLLAGMGAKVFVAAHGDVTLAHIKVAGFVPVALDAIGAYLKDMNLIFNTIPALVLTAELLDALSKEVFLLDLASKPGGVDLEAASRLGMDVKSVPGLPGLVAPQTAGQIVADVVLGIIEKNKTKGV